MRKHFSKIVMYNEEIVTLPHPFKSYDFEKYSRRVAFLSLPFRFLVCLLSNVSVSFSIYVSCSVPRFPSVLLSLFLGL